MTLFLNIEIKELERKDFNQARKFAVKGMNLSWYTSNKVELYLYSKYFWYLEILKATKALGAYHEEELVGVLLADMYEKPKVYHSFWANLFVRLAEQIIQLSYGSASSEYEQANKEMLVNFLQRKEPDGEINFFAVNPEIKGQGIGTKIFNQFEKLEAGSLVYLYTDSGSTYPFYLRRGFIKEDSRKVDLEIANKDVPLTCFLFSKRLGVEKILDEE